MSKTSIHFLEVKSTSEIHNFRKKKFEYCREDLLHLNEFFTEESISERRSKIEVNCKKYSGRKLQKNAKPIREGVVVINEHTTMNDLKKVADNLQKELGIKVFQIFLHRDEGHYDENDIWKTNYHAHLVAEWIDDKTKKMLKLNPQQMSKMQDICALSLGMERGQKSSRKHLSAIQYKLKIAEYNLILLEQKNNSQLMQIANELERKRKEYDDLKAKHEKLVNVNRIESIILERDVFLQDVEGQINRFSYDYNIDLNGNIKDLFHQTAKDYNWDFQQTLKWLQYPEFYNKTKDIMEKGINLRL